MPHRRATSSITSTQNSLDCERGHTNGYKSNPAAAGKEMKNPLLHLRIKRFESKVSTGLPKSERESGNKNASNPRMLHNEVQYHLHKTTRQQTSPPKIENGRLGTSQESSHTIQYHLHRARQTSTVTTVVKKNGFTSATFGEKRYHTMQVSTLSIPHLLHRGYLYITCSQS